MNLLFGVIVFASVIGLIGCGSKQDPFDGKPDAVKDGRLPVQKVQLPPPVESDALRISLSDDSVDSFTFKEEEESSFGVYAKTLEEDYDTWFEVMNANQFPGLKVEQGSGKISWMPPKGFVFGGTQSEDAILSEVKMIIVAYAKHKVNGAALTYKRERTVRIKVQKFKETPTISVSGLTDKEGKQLYFEENKTYDFVVKIQDFDSGPKPEQQPRLEVLALENQSISLAPFIKIKTIQNNFRKREYEYLLSMDLGKNNITENYSAAGFGLRAVSRFDRASAIHRIESGVLAKFGDVNITWTERQKMARGTRVVIPFLIFESSSRASIDITAEGNPENSTVTCAYSQKGIVACEFIWEVPSDEVEATGDFDIKVKAHSGNYNTQINNVEKKFKLDFEIVKPVRPRPTPFSGVSSILSKDKVRGMQ